MFKKELAKKLEENPFLHIGDWIYEKLYNEIISLRLMPGTKINESQLAADCGVSRSPVKYAVEKLMKEGLLREGQKFSYISPVDKVECERLCEARVGLECRAAFLASKRITEQELSRLKILAEEYSHIVEEEDFKSCATCDQEFHNIIIAATRNSCIQDMYNAILSRLMRYRHYTYMGIKSEIYLSVQLRAARCHQAIYDALRMRFATVAEAEMRQDIHGMLDIFSAWELTETKESNLEGASSQQQDKNEGKI